MLSISGHQEKKDSRLVIADLSNDFSSQKIRTVFKDKKSITYIVEDFSERPKA